MNKIVNEIKQICPQEYYEIGYASLFKATVEDSELDDAYEKTLRYSFSHKLAATRAGIG